MKTHVPKYLLTAKKLQHIQREKKYRKMENIKYNNNEAELETVPETRKKVIKVEE